MNYAAYLRVYEPVSAFHEPDRSRWAAYAASGARPRRRDALAVEQAERFRQMVTEPPGEDGEHAYVRFADGAIFICPWQIRLRSLLATAEVADEPDMDAEARAATLTVARPHIRTSAWIIPIAWFVPFAGAERWIALGREDPGQRDVELRAPAQVSRTLVYVTPMPRARRRITRGLAALRELRRVQEEPVLAMEDELAEVGRWLEEFHPYSLVELDYGGLVYLLSDDALCADESVAEIGASIDGMSRGHCELALAMYCRTQARWQRLKEFQQVN
jgi:hypothetical protein